MRFFSRLRKGLSGTTGKNLLKLTLYAVVCLAVLAALVGRIGNIDFFAKRTGYSAMLPDATGLLVNDEVKVAGVAVGKVTGVKVERGQAKVSFQVKPEVRLHSTDEVGVRWRNVLGQKYLYLYPHDGGRELGKGDTLPVDQAVQSADVGEFLNSVAPILRAIDPAKANAFIQALNQALDGNETKVRGLLGDAAKISSSLGGSDRQIGRLIDNLDTVVGGLANRNQDLDQVITRFDTLSGSLASNNDQLQLLVDRFAAVQAKLNTLVTDNRANIDGTINDLSTIAAVLSQHRGDLDKALATLPRGLRVYDSISSYGQWFQIRATITCLANQATCMNEGATADLLSSQQPADVTSVIGFALAGSAL